MLCLKNYDHPKQDFGSSNLLTRSIRRKGGSCFPANSLAAQLERYQLYAGARGYNPATILHVNRCLSYLNSFMGKITDVGAITGDDLRRFIIFLKDSKVRKNSQIYLATGMVVSDGYCGVVCSLSA
ncbi:hypothetical protein ACFLYB_06155 [Chloroflexota bacterium]